MKDRTKNYEKNYSFQSLKPENFVVDSAFEKVLNDVGSEGRFQKWIIIFFMIPLAIISTIGSSSTTLLLTTPDHSCHVPGRSDHNVTVDQWKNVTIPWEKSMLGEMNPSSCLMYNNPNIDILYNNDNISSNNHNISQMVKQCENGWDFDTSSWKETPVTEFNWVCDEKHVVATMFSITYTGNAIGNILFSFVSDRYGRKPTFYLALILNIICSVLITFIPNQMGFGICRFLLSLPAYVICEVPYIIVVELCSQRFRALTTATAFVAEVFGTFLMSYFAYLMVNWKDFIYVCHLPTVIFFVYYKFLPESPRWLLSQRRISECEMVLRRIAATNGNIYSESTRKHLLEAQEEETKKHSLRSIISSFPLVKHLVLTSSILSITLIIYAGMLLNIHYMKGDKILNYTILMLFDIPGGVLGSITAQYYGRRFSTVVLMGMSSICCLLSVFFITDQWALIVFCGLAKMFSSAAALVVYMQVGELFPTPLRTSAYGITGMIAIAAIIMIPPLIAMGDTNVFLPYYILSGIGLIGFVLSTFLPETIGRSLPQTTKEAISIGENQPFLSFIHKWNAHKYADHFRPKQREIEMYTIVPGAT